MNQAIKPVQAFLDHLHHHLNYSPHTIKNYRYDLNKVQAFSQRNQKPLQAFTKHDCRQCIASLASTLSKKTLSRFISSCRSFWQYLIHYHNLPNNPWKQLRLPKPEKTLPKILATDTLLRFLDNIDTSTLIGLRNRCICECLYGLGLRVSELCAMQITQLSLKKRQCIIMGKGKKERITIFGDITALIIESYLNKARPSWATANSTHVFINQKGQNLSTRSIQRILKALSNEQHISPEITPHTLRHCFASDLYKGGADLSIIKELLGHGHLSTTEIYTHVANEELQQTIQLNHPHGQ